MDGQSDRYIDGQDTWVDRQLNVQMSCNRRMLSEELQYVSTDTERANIQETLEEIKTDIETDRQFSNVCFTGMLF